MLVFILLLAVSYNELPLILLTPSGFLSIFCLRPCRHLQHSLVNTTVISAVTTSVMINVASIMIPTAVSVKSSLSDSQPENSEHLSNLYMNYIAS